MKRSLAALTVIALAAVASAADAQPRFARQSQSDPLGPRSSPNGTVAESVARVEIERNGYRDVHGLMRVSNGGWQALARGGNNAAVVVALDNQGKVTEVR